MSKIGLLLINVGTPTAPTTEAVQSYLNEFLTDPFVIQAPTFVRNILFKKFIIPRRSPKSALKYQKIWTEKGSPLLSHSLDFAHQLQLQLGDQFIVKASMRYGSHSLDKTIDELKTAGVDKFFIAPLFPQYAEATTGTVLKKVSELLPHENYQVLNEFYKSDQFISACLSAIKESKKEWDHLLFSYHGLPVSQVKKTSGCFKNLECCKLAEKNQIRCYRSQCLITSQKLAEAMNLKSDQWSVSFQSRLGPVKWIEPYTDKIAVDLAQRGVKRLGVFAPSFVVDGLETLEEIQIELKETFLRAGGNEFTYIPCLNSNPVWVQNFAKLIKKSFDL